MLALVAKAAANIGRDDADTAFGQSELFGNIAPDVMGHLRRTVERQLLARGVGCGQHRARFDRRSDQPIVDEIDAGHMRRCLQRPPHGGLVAARPAKADVSRNRVVELSCLRCARFARIDNGREGFVADLDQVRRIDGLLARLRDHDRDRLADVANVLARECPAWRLCHRSAVDPLDRPKRTHRADPVGCHVGAAENGYDTGRAERRRRFDIANGSVRVRGAHDRGMEFAGDDDIGDEAAAAAQQPDILDAPDRYADSFPRGLNRGVYCNSSRSRSSRS